MWWKLIVHANPLPLEHALTCGVGGLAAKEPRLMCGEVSDPRMIRHP
jgi:hypothetical protein